MKVNHFFLRFSFTPPLKLWFELSKQVVKVFLVMNLQVRTGSASGLTTVVKLGHKEY